MKLIWGEAPEKNPEEQRLAREGTSLSEEPSAVYCNWNIAGAQEGCY